MRSYGVWTGHPHRATRDLDLLGFGDAGAERLRATFAEVAQVTVPDDGVTLDPSSLEVGPIREGDETAVSASASRRASPPPSSASR
jgi:hypothetical protein